MKSSCPYKPPRSNDLPRAFSAKGAWRYSQNRSDERVRQIRKSVKTLLGINRFLSKVVSGLVGRKQFRPDKIDPSLFITEVDDVSDTVSYFAEQ